MNLSDGQLNAIIEAPDVDLDLSLLYKAAGESPRRRRVVPTSFSVLGSGRPQPYQGFLSPEIMRAIYARSEIVRACVDTLIELVCTVEFTVRPSDEDHSKWLKKRRPEQYANQQKRVQWAKAFFRRPNSYEGFSKFQRKLLRDLLVLDWGAYEVVHADMGGYSLPIEMGAIAGETVEVEVNEAGMPVRYWQSRNVLHQTPFELDEIGVICQFPSTWQPYGFSILETAFVSIAADLNANQHNNDFFGADGVPPGLLAVLGVSEPEFRRIMARINSTKKDNPHNIHGFRAGRDSEGKPQDLFQYIPLGQNNRDMQWKELITLTINRICMLYKVTPSQIGFTEQVAGGIGSGVAETQENLQQNKGVAPLLQITSSSYSEMILHKACGWNDLECAHVESHTPQEEADYARDTQELQLGSMTINELRSKWGGREPVEWGDDPLNMPQSYQQKQQMQQQAMMGGMGGGMQPDQGDNGDAAQLPGGQPGQLQKSGRSLIIRF